MTVNKVDDPEAFRTAVKGVYDKYSERVGGPAAIAAVIETK